MLQGLGANAFQHARVVLAQKITNAEQNFGLTSVQDINSLRTFHSRIQRHHDSACGVDATSCQDPFRNIGRPYRHTIAGLNT